MLPCHSFTFSPNTYFIVFCISINKNKIIEDVKPTHTSGTSSFFFDLFLIPRLYFKKSKINKMLKDQRSHIMLTYFTFSIPSLPPSFFGLAVLWFEFIFAVTNLLTEIIFIFLHKLKQISHPTPVTANKTVKLTTKCSCFSFMFFLTQPLDLMVYSLFVP